MRTMDGVCGGHTGGLGPDMYDPLIGNEMRVNLGSFDPG